MYFYLFPSIVLVLYTLSPFGDAQSIRKDILSHPNWKLLDRKGDCGHSVTDRIIGGTKARLGQYPWLARIGYSRYDPSKVDIYDCGGSIINNRYILSAAHCCSEVIGMQMIQVRLGEHDARSDKDCEGSFCAPPTQDINVEEELCHPNYDLDDFYNDISLLRLAKPIVFNDYVRPICLPVYDTFTNNNFERAVMEVAGWGVFEMETYNITSDILMTLRVPIVPRHTCQEFYFGKVKIIQKQLCAGGIIGEDSCSGDSGGALMKAFSIKAPPRYFVIGVVSFGPRKCGASNTPAVYTQVSYYMKWILDTIRK